ncbi:MAG: CBS domain-containing protein [Acidimicrobiales bacterium]
MSAPRVVLDARNGAAEAAAKLQRDNLPGAPVVDENGVFIGTVSTRALRDAAPTPASEESLDAHQGTDVGRLADPTAPTVLEADRLSSALESLMNAGTNWIPVLDADRRVAGILSISAVVRGYRAGLTAGLSQVSRISPRAVALDVRVSSRSPTVGLPLGRLGLPPGTIVMTLQRDADQLLPRGSTIVEAEDGLGILTREEDLERVRRLFSPTTETSPR